MNTYLSLGPRYGEAKRRAHDHDHPHHLPRLLGRLRDDSAVVSVKHTPTFVGHVYNHREKYGGQEGREHAPLTKTLFHSELPRVHPVVEPHACSHAIVELTNDRDHILWHPKTGEYCLEEGSVNGVVRFGKERWKKHAYNKISFFRANSCSRTSYRW